MNRKDFTFIFIVQYTSMFVQLSTFIAKLFSDQKARKGSTVMVQTVSLYVTFIKELSFEC